MPTGVYPRKPCSAGTKAKISKTKKGKPWTKAQKEAHIFVKRPMSPKMRQHLIKMIWANIGVKRSKESIERLSKAAIQRYTSIEERIKARKRF